MGTNLDELTKKLYDEGISKANAEAEVIISDAKKKAEKLLADAEAEAKKIADKSLADAESKKQKSDTEISMAAKNAESKLKQTITELIAGKVASNLSSAVLDDKKYVQELIIKLVEKWDISSGSLNLAVALSEKDKAEFETLVASKYKALLDKGLEIKVGNLKGGFSIGPKDGNYQITFTQELFDAFFSQYLRGITKELLYK